MSSFLPYFPTYKPQLFTSEKTPAAYMADAACTKILPGVGAVQHKIGLIGLGRPLSLKLTCLLPKN